MPPPPSSKGRLSRRHSYLLSFGIVCAGICSLLAFLLNQAYLQAEQQAVINARNINSILETRLNETLRRLQTNLEEIATLVPAEAMTPAAVAQHDAQMTRWLSLQTAHFPEIVGFRLLDARGTLLYSSQTGLPKPIATDRDYFETLKRHPETPIFFSEVSTGRITHRPLLFVAVPIRDSRRQFLGVAMAPLDLERLQHLLDSIQLGPHGANSVRRYDDGRFILRQPTLHTSVNKPLHQHPIHTRIHAGEYEGTVRFRAQMDNFDRLYAFKRIGDYPFYVTTGLASQDYLQGWRDTAISAASIAGALMLSLALLLWRLLQTQQRAHKTTNELRENKNRFRLLLNSVGQPICGIDTEGRCTFSNAACLQILGYQQAEQLLGQDMRLYLDSRQLAERLIAAVQQGLPFYSDSEVLRKADGQCVPVELRSYPQYHRGQLLGAVVIAQDISERQEAAARIEFLAFHDSLTGLPNRLQMRERFETAIAQAKQTGEQLALLFLDLDHFKTINDSLGHGIGDALLCVVAQRLKACLPPNDTVGRLGGDEFLILLNGPLTAHPPSILLQKILQRLSEPFQIEQHHLSISPSIGVALYPEHGRDFAALLTAADTAMYHAKDAGRNTYHLYEQQMGEAGIKRMHLLIALRQALELGQLTLHYQPQIDLASGNIIGAEALVRWLHPEKGLIPPGEFIPIAEASGLIIPIGAWVLQEACKQAAAWRRAGLPELVMAVNCSALQFKQAELVETVQTTLRDTQLAPHYLELELTESVLIDDSEQVLETITQLKTLGVKLAIDDFGTGYSSLAYLKRFAVDKIKIDQSFIRGLITSPDDAAIVQAIIRMAHSLNLSTIAEGVEDQAVLACLHQIQCDEAQGYHFAAPLPAPAFERFVRAAQNNHSANLDRVE